MKKLLFSLFAKHINMFAILLENKFSLGIIGLEFRVGDNLLVTPNLPIPKLVADATAQGGFINLILSSVGLTPPSAFTQVKIRNNGALPLTAGSMTVKKYRADGELIGNQVIGFAQLNPAGTAVTISDFRDSDEGELVQYKVVTTVNFSE